jgi:hypothetical protein
MKDNDLVEPILKFRSIGLADRAQHLLLAELVRLRRETKPKSAMSGRPQIRRQNDQAMPQVRDLAHCIGQPAFIERLQK